MPRDRMTQDEFIRLTRNAAWGSIDDFMKMLDGADFWSEDFIEAAVDARKKDWIRHQLREIKDPKGWPIYASVERIDPFTEKSVRVYKQESLFDRDDYRQVVSYHQRRAQHHREMAMGYAARASKRYQMRLPVDGMVVVDARA